MAANGMTSHRARFRFERLPATYCHPDRIGALLPEGLPASFQGRLLGSKRLRARLSSLLIERFQLGPCTADDLTTPEGRFATLEGDELEGLILGIGAVWHARTLRRIILAAELRELIGKLGRDNHKRALRFADLAPEDEGGGAEMPDIDSLMVMIRQAGVRAINAWSRHQPAALAARLRLKLPPGDEADAEPSEAQQERGLMIVDRVVMSLSANPEELVMRDGGHG